MKMIMCENDNVWKLKWMKVIWIKRNVWKCMKIITNEIKTIMYETLCEYC